MPSHVHSVDPPSTNFTSGGQSVNHQHVTGGQSVGHTHANTASGSAYEWITRIPTTGTSIRVYTRNSNADQGIQGGIGVTMSNAANNVDHNHGNTGDTTADHNHTTTVDIAAFNSASAGSGGSHNNLQPYIVLNYIIKV
jgi:microcystin-dependent protein